MKCSCGKTIEWYEVGSKSVVKDKPLPRTEENFTRILLMRDSLIDDMRVEISKLKMKVNQLRSK